MDSREIAEQIAKDLRALDSIAKAHVGEDPFKGEPQYEGVFPYEVVRITTQGGKKYVVRVEAE